MQAGHYQAFVSVKLASKGPGLRASVVGSSQARLQLGCSPVEDGMRSGKRRIAASAAIEGG